jgi:hypothetical protein
MTSDTHETYVTNILREWDALTPDQIAEGKAWYHVAHSMALGLGNGDIRKGAGILAALSPLKSWEENVKLATQAANGNVRGHFPDACRKASAIMAGADPTEVLPMDAKTGNFYLCILDPSDPNAVAVDRHAAHTALGESRKGGLKPKLYGELKAAFVDAGARRNVLPSVMQAGVWSPRARGW